MTRIHRFTRCIRTFPSASPHSWYMCYSSPKRLFWYVNNMCKHTHFITFFHSDSNGKACTIKTNNIKDSLVKLLFSSSAADTHTHYGWVYIDLGYLYVLWTGCYLSVILFKMLERWLLRALSSVNTLKQRRKSQTTSKC